MMMMAGNSPLRAIDWLATAVLAADHRKRQSRA
jgi:hypothetical protein